MWAHVEPSSSMSIHFIIFRCLVTINIDDLNAPVLPLTHTQLPSSNNEKIILIRKIFLFFWDLSCRLKSPFLTFCIILGKSRYHHKYLQVQLYVFSVNISFFGIEMDTWQIKQWHLLCILKNILLPIRCGHAKFLLC